MPNTSTAKTALDAEMVADRIRGRPRNRQVNTEKTEIEKNS